MKKRPLLILLLLLIFLPSCKTPDEADESGEGTLLYYILPEESARGGDRIQARRETLEFPEHPTPEEEARAVIERLMSGSSDDSVLSPLPEGASLLGLEVRDRMACVDFSEEIRELSGVDLALTDYCLTLSLTGLDSVGAVTITAQGRPIGQQPKQVFYERDILLSDMGDVLQTAEVSLYYLNSDGTLVPERRTLSLHEGQRLADTLAAALLEGPESRDLVRAIPADFTVNYVRVESGICYVSLPAASLELLPEDEQTQRVILWSLADSLYSIESINEIRLLADGEELEFFGLVPAEDIAVRP